jgi:hypothetical protein
MAPESLVGYLLALIVGGGFVLAAVRRNGRAKHDADQATTAFSSWSQIMAQLAQRDQKISRLETEVAALRLENQQLRQRVALLQAAVDVLLEKQVSTQRVAEILPTTPDVFHAALPDALLVDALLRCPSLSNEETRAAIISELPDDVRAVLKPTANLAPKVAVTQLLATCRNYSHGGEILLAVLRKYEGDSISMRVVDLMLGTK